MGETLGGKGTNELRPPPKPEEAATPPDTPMKTTKIMKSTSPKNAPTRNETDVKSERKDQPRVNRLDGEDPLNAKRPKLETVDDCRGPARISPW